MIDRISSVRNGPNIRPGIEGFGTRNKFNINLKMSDYSVRKAPPFISSFRVYYYLRCFHVLCRLLLSPADDIAGGTSAAVFLRLCINTIYHVVVVYWKLLPQDNGERTLNKGISFRFFECNLYLGYFQNLEFFSHPTPAPPPALSP